MNYQSYKGTKIATPWDPDGAKKWAFTDAQSFTKRATQSSFRLAGRYKTEWLLHFTVLHAGKMKSRFNWAFQKRFCAKPEKN